MIDAKELYDEAIGHCMRTSNNKTCGESEIIALLKEGDKENHSKLRYSLAKSLCRYVAGEEYKVKAVYVFGSTDKDCASFVSDIDLIFWVGEKTEILDYLLREADKSLTEYYKGLVGERVEGMGNLLDCKIVDDKEIKMGLWPASVITSKHEPRTKIFKASG